MLTRFNQFTIMLVLTGCFVLPCIGCGSSTDPVGVEGDGVAELEELQQDPDYIKGEKNL